MSLPSSATRSPTCPRRRPPRPRAARPAHLGHRPLQLPLHLLHAARGVRPGLPVPAARRTSSRSRRSRGWRAVVRRRWVCASSASPAASRCCGATSSGSSAMLAGVDGLDDLALTTNGSLLARKADALAAAGLRRITVSLDSLDDDVFARLNDVAFPVRAGAGGHRGRRAGRPRARSRSTWSCAAASTRTASCRWRASRGSAGYILRFIEYMDVGHTNGWRLDEVVPIGRDPRHDRRRDALEPVPAARTRARSPTAGATATARGEVGVISSSREPFCGDLHARPPHRRGAALHVPLRRARHRPARPAACRRGRRRAARLIGGVWAARADRYSELRWRRDDAAAQGGDVPHRWLKAMLGRDR